VLATYIHNWDPVIFDVAGPIKLRWYGLGYLLAFVIGYFLLRWQARKKLWVLPEDKVADFVAYAAFFGVFLGGRIGYILFYLIPAEGMAPLIADPLLVFKVWKGGMASHGGILGLLIFTYIYARKNKVSWPGLGDGLCVVAPLGLGLVRIANFINGELYGRVAHGVSWAMKFPASMNEDLKGDPDRWNAVFQECRKIDPSIDGKTYDYIVAQSRDNPELLNALGNHLLPRHPSQLYESFLEGLVLFTILFFLRVRFPKMAHGVLTGLFFLLYAVFRIIVEGYRQPDVGQAFILGLTKGQFYSTFMIVIGLAFIGFALWNKGRLSAVK